MECLARPASWDLRLVFLFICWPFFFLFFFLYIIVDMDDANYGRLIMELFSVSIFVGSLL